MPVPVKIAKFQRTRHSGSLYGGLLFACVQVFGDTLQEVDGDPLLFVCCPVGCQGYNTVSMEKLYSYKMSHDDRFAPNPYHGVLTLATCKPYLRLKAEVGSWIAGWTAKAMVGHSFRVGQEKLVYLAKVTEKLSFEEYWNNYPSKRPGKGHETLTGDNIYCPDVSEPDGYRLVPNYRHCARSQKDKDLKGKYVLVCKEFYYFGGTCDATPLEIPESIRPNVPKGQTSVGYVTDNPMSFINFVRQNADKCELCNF